MDKLKPLIQHHFWILFVLVLILPIIGWMPATGQFSQQTATKLTQINEAFTKIPNGQHANKTWGDQLDNKVKQAERKNRDALRQLWERQEKMMVWPNTIRRDLQPKTYLQEISPIARNIYKNNYDIEVRKVWQKINPFDYETGKGTVLYKLEQMPRQQFGDLTPTSQELWDAQEDLWLLSSLFGSIRRANSDATVLTESLVRSIKTLYLVGGAGEYPQAESTGGMEGMGGEFSPEMMDPGMMGDAGAFGMDNRRPVSAGSLSFNPADEFGMEQGRYVDYKPGEIFKKRGFYMEAIIDHQRLPELLSTLSNGAWPVTITRVQMVQVGFTGGGAGASGRPGFGGGAGFGGGGGGSLLGRPSMGRPNFGGPSRGLGGFPGDDMMAGDMMDAGGGMGQPGTNMNTEHASMAAAAEVGPQLAMVAISGVIYFYNPPELVDEATQTPAPVASPTPETAAPEVAVPATETPAAEQPASPPVPAEGESPNETPPADAATADPEAPATAPAAPAVE